MSDHRLGSYQLEEYRVMKQGDANLPNMSKLVTQSKCVRYAFTSRDIEIYVIIQFHVPDLLSRNDAADPRPYTDEVHAPRDQAETPVSARY